MFRRAFLHSQRAVVARTAQRQFRAATPARHALWMGAAAAGLGLALSTAAVCAPRDNTENVTRLAIIGGSSFLNSSSLQV